MSGTKAKKSSSRGCLRVGKLNIFSFLNHHYWEVWYVLYYHVHPRFLDILFAFGSKPRNVIVSGTWLSTGFRNAICLELCWRGSPAWFNQVDNETNWSISSLFIRRGQKPLDPSLQSAKFCGSKTLGDHDRKLFRLSSHTLDNPIGLLWELALVPEWSW